MINAQESTNSLFILITHFQHKLPCSPFNIPGQGKGGAHRMNRFSMKSGYILIGNRVAVYFPIPWFENVFHK